jgi:hypothetical protein
VEGRREGRGERDREVAAELFFVLTTLQTSKWHGEVVKMKAMQNLWDFLEEVTDTGDNHPKMRKVSWVGGGTEPRERGQVFLGVAEAIQFFGHPFWTYGLLN